MAESTEDHEAAAKAKKKKMMMIVGGLVVAGLAYQFVLKGAPPEAGDAEVDAVVEEGEIAPLEEMVVNLADTDEVHYLRLGVAAVLDAEVAADEVEPQLPKVNDVVIDVVSAKTFDELRAPGSTAALKEELSTAVQEAFPEGEVVRVIFTTFVMQ